MKRYLPLFFAATLCVGATFAGETNTILSLTLAQAHALALRNHPLIAAANYRALAAGEGVKEARSGFFPQANLYGTAAGADSQNTRILAGGLNNPSVFDRAAGGVGVSQLITDFGRTANLTASSRLLAQAAGRDTAATSEQVLLDVDANYFGTLEAKAVLEVARQTLDTRKLLVDRVSTLASNKIKSELDVSFANVALEEGRLLVETAQNDYDASFASLSTAFGYPELHRFQLFDQQQSDSGMTNDVTELIETALRNRPELLSLRAQRDAALKFATSQKDARLPTIAAVGAAGESPIHNSRLADEYAAGAVQISVPLFAGGLYSARQHEAELRAQAEAESLRTAEDNIIRDVRIAWLNLNNARQRLRTTAQLVAHATEAFDLAQARYNVGSSSMVELSQAQLSKTEAEIAQARAKFDYRARQAILDYQTGRLN